jgi:hypothetical protein
MCSREIKRQHLKISLMGKPNISKHLSLGELIVCFWFSSDRHGVKQLLNCWADGVPMITQRPILPNQNLTYRFDVAGQEGTLWWHSHVPCFRATIHGILIIRPRRGAVAYPFPKPHKEIPVIIGT